MTSRSANIEDLKFSLALRATYWDRKPKTSIWLDNELITTNYIGDLENIEFTRRISEGEHCLKIRLEEKRNSDVVIENGEVVKDMLLNIDDISVDDISLGNLLWAAEYHLDQPQVFKGKTITELSHCVNLGWNGSYILQFTSPFYVWLLENL